MPRLGSAFAALLLIAASIMVDIPLLDHVRTGDGILAQLHAAPDAAVLVAQQVLMESLFADVRGMAERLFEPIVLVVILMFFQVQARARTRMLDILLTLGVLAALNSGMAVNFYSVSDVSTVQQAINAVEFHGYALRGLIAATGIVSLWGLLVTLKIWRTH